MATINTLDLKTFISNATKNVFTTMLSMDVEPVNLNIQQPEAGKYVVGSVCFAGTLMGSINIRVNDDLARRMTAAMLGMEVDEIEGDEEVHDVIGELCNMIGGNLKSRLCDTGFPCQLSIPCITYGNSFMIQSKDWARKELLAFRYQKHTALVEVYMKSGE
jgi:chemotaxis protein CheX